VNDQDLEEVAPAGVVTVLEWSAGMKYARELVQAPSGRGGIYAPDTSLPPRNPIVVLNIKSATVAERDGHVERILDVFHADDLNEIRFGDRPDKVLDARLEEEEFVAITPSQALKKPRGTLTLKLECPDPAFRSRYKRSVAFGTGRRPISLWTLESPAILYLMGASTNPITVIYRDSGGTVIATLVLAVALGSTEYLEIDLAENTVLRYTAGVAGLYADGSALWSGDWFVPHPKHGSKRMSAFPTIEQTGATDALLIYSFRGRT